MTRATPQGAGVSHTTIGITDLMTSLAVVFILLFAAQITKTSSAAQSELQENKQDVQTALRDHIQQLGLSLDADPRDPLALLIVVPENRLTFEFGKSTLSSTSDQFLADALPFYVGALCGPLHDKIDSLAIEGHTDDHGSDAFNLKLSQERSLAVMVKGMEIVQANVPSAYQCFQEITSATGRGRQDLIYDAPAIVNREKSRRVIFKIRLRSAEQLHQLEPSTKHL
ncbi:MAG: OmpA family protein [Nitrospirota bacterium]|nr:OmpA family protein [Nitrospirota bacterium]MDP2383261.1 OmpA family protein [Nitrospirota bacterium]